MLTFAIDPSTRHTLAYFGLLVFIVAPFLVGLWAVDREGQGPPSQ